MNHVAGTYVLERNPPMNRDERLKAGVAYHQAQQFEDAVLTYRGILQDFPADGEVLLLMGIAYYYLNAFDDALHVLEQAVEQIPENIAAHIQLARTCLNSGRPRRAKEAYDAALSVDSEYPNLAAERDRFMVQPVLTLPGGLQGSHAPERQVFMSAAVDLQAASGGPVRVLEIGAYAGASAITWCNAIERFSNNGGSLLCIDPWGHGAGMEDIGGTDGNQDPEQVYEVFLHNISNTPDTVSIDHKRGLSADIVSDLSDASYDIAYVDGCHFYVETLADIEECDRLIPVGGFICGDDLELQGHEVDIDWARQHQAEDFITDPSTNRYFHPGVALAVHDFFGPVSVYGGFWIMCKTTDGYEPVSFSAARGLIPAHWGPDHASYLKSYFKNSNELGELIF